MTTPVINRGPIRDDLPGGMTNKEYQDLYCPITSRAQTYEGTDGSSGTGTAITTFARTGRTIHRISGTARAVKLEYLNWYTQPNNPGEVNGPNSVTYRATIEYPAGNWRQISGSTTWSSATSYSARDQVIYSGSAYVALTTTTIATTPAASVGTEWQLVTRYSVNFSGQDANRRVTVAAGEQVVSLPVILSVAEGQYMAVTTTVVTGNAANGFCADIIGTGTGEFAQDYSSAAPTLGTVDLVDKNVTTETNMASGTRVPMPSAIFGLQPNAEMARYVTLLGDSLVMGYLDTATDSHLKGFSVRGAEYEDVRYRRIPQGGDRLQFWTASNAAKRLALAQPSTAIVCSLGSNDVANSRTLAQLQADSIAAWTEMGRKGARVYQCTITPKTTSTDGWATKANQTPVFAAGGVRDTYNTWLRAGASYTINGNTVTMGMTGHPLNGIVDLSPAVEDTSDSHYFKSPGWTTDGGHPTALGYDAMAVAMRGYFTSMLFGAQFKHAQQHSSSGVDPITPTSIGAADSLTLGGWMPGILGYAGLPGYLLRGGEKYASCPPACVTSTYAMPAATLIVLLGPGGYTGAGSSFSSVKFYLSAAAASGSVQVYLSTSGTYNALGTAQTVSATTGWRSIALGASFDPNGGFLAVRFLFTGTKPTFAATPASSTPVPAQGQNGLNLVVQTADATLPASFTTPPAGGTGVTQLPFVALS